MADRALISQTGHFIHNSVCDCGGHNVIESLREQYAIPSHLPTGKVGSVDHVVICEAMFWRRTKDDRALWRRPRGVLCCDTDRGINNCMTLTLDLWLLLYI